MRRLLVLVTMIIGITIIAGCQSKTSDVDVIPIQSIPLSNYTDGFKYTAKQTLTSEEIESNGLEESNDEDYEVTYEKVTATTSYDEITSFGANNDILYPGALINFTTMSPIQTKRNPIDISIGLETATNIGTGSLMRTVDNPKLSAVRDQIKSLVQEHINETSNLPARITYEVREVNSEQEFGLNLGFALQKGLFALSNNFEMNSIKKQTNVIIVLKQIYYTVDVDTPDHKLDFFNASNKEINDILKGDVVPVYVSSVAYGRVAMISIQSNFSKREIENQLQASWGKMSDNPGASKIKLLSVEFDNTIKSIASDSDTTIRAFIYGGDSSNIQDQIITSSSDLSLQNIFGSYDALSSVGLPISYTLRHIDGTLAKIQNSNEYIIKNVKYVPKKIMNWDYYNQLVETKEIRDLSDLTIDISAIKNTNANQTITIPENIKKIIFLGVNDITQKQVYNNLSIQIAPRSEELEINLSNISFSGNSNSAIYGNSLSKVILNLSGEVDLIGAKGYEAIKTPNLEIRGSESTSVNITAGDGDPGNDGKSAIVAEDSIVLNLAGSLTIKGGNGGTGLDGLGYDRGSNPYNDRDGKNGENGYTGGKGGATIVSNSISFITSNTLRLKLISGSGGNGGKGGDGEFAGFEKAPTAKAGIGGKGGAGGNSGELLDFTDLTIEGNLHRLTIEYGNPGDGGAGGNGGHADQLWAIFLIKWSDPGVGGSGGIKGEVMPVSEPLLTLFKEYCSEQNIVITSTNTARNGVNGVSGVKDLN